MTVATETASLGDAEAERVLMALRISGRRLMRRADGTWGVRCGANMRRPMRMRVDAALVEKLTVEGRLSEDPLGGFVLADQFADRGPPVQDWAMLAAGVPKRNRGGGFGFRRLAIQARSGHGPLTLRHVKAGMRLAADAEREATGPGLTMDWLAVPAGKTRRGPGRGGQAASAAEATRRLRLVRSRVGEPAWRIAWATCVESATLATLRRQFGLDDDGLGPEIAAALEAVADAYDGK
jgi:hypothetical protein